MPLLRRLFWPLLTLPAAFAVVVFLAIGRGSAWMLHAFAMLLAPASFGLLYWGLRRTYARWSLPPEEAAWGQVLVPPEPVVLVTRGGYLTPATASFTEQALKVFAGGRLLLEIPLARVGDVSFHRGRVLRTPYVDFTAPDGRRLARVGVESAQTWVTELRRVRAPAAA